MPRLLLMATLLVFPVACFVDGTGEAPANQNLPFGTVGPSTGATTTTGGGGSQQGGGGQGGQAMAVCGDGLVETPESCEDGNQAPDDGCTDCALEASCGNNLVEPGEACDGSSDCDGSCELLASSACASASSLLAGYTQGAIDDQSPAAFGSFSDFGTDCVVLEDLKTEVYRYQAPPYPEGLLVRAAFDNPGDDMVLYAYEGCGQEKRACTVAFDRASLDFPALPPSTELFFGVTNFWTFNAPFKIYARPYRYRSTFDSDPGWTLDTGWSFDDSNDELALLGMGDNSGAESPEIYIAGVSTDLLLELHYNSDGAASDVALSFDGGGYQSVGVLNDQMGGGFLLRRLTSPIPSGAQRVRVRVSSTANLWLTDLIVGPLVEVE